MNENLSHSLSHPEIYKSLLLLSLSFLLIYSPSLVNTRAKEKSVAPHHRHTNQTKKKDWRVKWDRRTYFCALRWLWALNLLSTLRTWTGVLVYRAKIISRRRWVLLSPHFPSLSLSIHEMRNSLLHSSLVSQNGRVFLWLFWLMVFRQPRPFSHDRVVSFSSGQPHPILPELLSLKEYLLLFSTCPSAENPNKTKPKKNGHVIEAIQHSKLHR